MPKKFETTDALEQVERIGLTPLFDTYLGSTQKHKVKCSCGEEFFLVFSTVTRRLRKDPCYKLVCKKCVDMSFRDTKYTAEALRELFLSKNMYPLFSDMDIQELQEKNLSKVFRRVPLPFRCVCGKPSKMSLNNLVDNLSDRTEIRCRACRNHDSSLRSKFREDIQNQIVAFESRFNVKVLNSEHVKKRTDPASILCSSCGNVHTVSWISLLSWEKPPVCFSCQNVTKPKGKEHASYNPALTQEDRDSSRHGRSFLAGVWSNFLRKIYSFRCAFEKKQKNRLNCHHIRPWKFHPFERFSFANGVVMSENIHKEFHLRYGKHCDNSVEFFSFFKEKTGCEYTPPKIRHQFITSLEVPTPEQELNLAEIRKELHKQGVFFQPIYFKELLTREEFFFGKIKKELGLVPVDTNTPLIQRDCAFPLKIGTFLSRNAFRGNAPFDICLSWEDPYGQILAAIVLKRVSVQCFDILEFVTRTDFYREGVEKQMFETFREKFKPRRVTCRVDARWVPVLTSNYFLSGLGFELEQEFSPEIVPLGEYEVQSLITEITPGVIRDCGSILFAWEGK